MGNRIGSGWGEGENEGIRNSLTEEKACIGMMNEVGGGFYRKIRMNFCSWDFNFVWKISGGYVGER